MSSMPAVDLDDELPSYPDELKMPENPLHRRVAETVAHAVHHEAGGRLDCFRDMNWYPPDGGNAIAPDVMVLPPAVVVPPAKSYRQPPDGPTPAAVVEIPSETDSFASFRRKVQRLQALGPVVYIIVADPGTAAVLRLAPGEAEPSSWNGLPMPELGGITVTVDPGAAGVTFHTTDGLSFSSSEQLQDLFAAGAARAAELEARTAELEARTAELEEKLRAMGLDPDAPSPPPASAPPG